MSSERFLLAAISHLHNFDHKVTADHKDIKLLTLLAINNDKLCFHGNKKLGIKYLLGKLQLSTLHDVMENENLEACYNRSQARLVLSENYFCSCQNS